MKNILCYWGKDPSDSWMDGRRKYLHFLEDIEEITGYANVTLGVFDALRGLMDLETLFISLTTLRIEGDVTCETQPSDVKNETMANTEYVTNAFKQIAFFHSPKFIGNPTAPAPSYDSNSKQMAVTGWVNNRTDKYLINNDINFKSNTIVPNTSITDKSDLVVNTMTANNIINNTLANYANWVNAKFTGIPTTSIPTTNEKQIATTAYTIDKLSEASNNAFSKLQKMVVEAGTSNDGQTIPPPEGYTSEQCAFFITSRNYPYTDNKTIAYYCEKCAIDSDGKVTCYLDTVDVDNNYTRRSGGINYLVIAQSSNCKTLS